MDDVRSLLAMDETTMQAERARALARVSDGHIDGDTLRRARSALGMTADALADACLCAPFIVLAWETGLYPIGTYEREVLTRLLRCAR